MRIRGAFPCSRLPNDAACRAVAQLDLRPETAAFPDSPGDLKPVVDLQSGALHIRGLATCGANCGHVHEGLGYGSVFLNLPEPYPVPSRLTVATFESQRHAAYCIGVD
jgi:hypothetical protein